MTVRSTGTTSPLTRRTGAALKRLKERVAKYMAEGMDEATATQKVRDEMREVAMAESKAAPLRIHQLAISVSPPFPYKELPL